MQKSLIAMNVQLHNALSDIGGTSGQAIIRALLAGQRDPKTLAALRDRRCMASEDEIVHSLQGVWKPDVLFELQQAVDAYDFYRQQMAQCDEQLKQYMALLPARRVETIVSSAEPTHTDMNKKSRSRKPRKPQGNEPGFDLEAELERILSVNATTIDGINVMTVSDRTGRGGTRPECLENRGPLVILAEFSSQARCERRKGDPSCTRTPHQSCRKCVSNGRAGTDTFSQLPRRKVPISSGQVGRPQSSQSYGARFGLPLLSTCYERTEMGRSRHRGV